MSTRWTLDVVAMQSEFFSDTALIGIVSALPAYRFCWMLNQKFDMDFVRDADSDICKPGADDSQDQYYSLYKYRAPLNGNKYLIYKLKNDQDSLLPEVKQLDYLWMIQSNSPDADAAQLTQYLRDIPDVQLAQILAPDKLKSLGHLIV